MIKRMSFGDRFLNAVNNLLLLIVCISIIYPIYYMFIVSISDGYAVTRGEVALWPVGIDFRAYKALLLDPYIPRAYLNTIIYTLAGTTVNICMTAFCAYPMSRKNFYGRGILTFIVVFTMMFDAGMVSNFLVVKTIGIKDTILAIILPPAINVWYMVIMRTFFASIPDELHQSAFVDGANDLGIFFKIILPLSKPVLASMVLFYSVWHWNSFFPALLYLDDRRLYPMQLVMRNIVIGSDMSSMQGAISVTGDTAVIGKSIKYAIIFVTIAPILAVYPFVQKYFVKGVMVGALKG